LRADRVGNVPEVAEQFRDAELAGGGDMSLRGFLPW
jgi:hypothetical protein